MLGVPSARQITFSMTRCWIDPGGWPDNAAGITLSADESRHLLKVLRAGKGDIVSVFDGRGRCCEAGISSTTAGAVRLEPIAGAVQFTPPPHPPVILVQAIAKSHAMDMVVQKSAELGVSRIVPVITERCVVKPGKSGAQTERWKKILVNAAKQCGLNHIPEIDAIKPLPEILKNPNRNGILFFGSLADDAMPFRKIPELATSAPESISVVIGPEGDFSDAERELIKSQCGLPVSLGPRVLRVETAAICALTLVNHLFRDL